MKRLVRIISAGLILIAAAAPSVFAEQILLQKPVAVVNLTKPEMITESQLAAKVNEYRQLQVQAGKDADTVTESGILDVMINDLLVLQGAERDGITLNDQEVNSLVARQKESFAAQAGSPITDAQFSQIIQQYYGLTVDEFREKLYQNYLVDTYVKARKGDVIDSAKAPTEQQIQEYYKKNAAKFINAEYVEISHIFISRAGKTDEDARGLAEKIYRNIRYGVKTYDEQVLEYSDDENSKYIGGRIGWLAIDDAARKQILGDEFFEAAFSLEEDAYSRAVRSNSGYHIIKLLDHRDPALLTLDDTVTPGNRMTVRQYISQAMYQNNQATAYNAAISSLISDLRAEASIEILLGDE